MCRALWNSNFFRLGRNGRLRNNVLRYNQRQPDQIAFSWLHPGLQSTAAAVRFVTASNVESISQPVNQVYLNYAIVFLHLISVMVFIICSNTFALFLSLLSFRPEGRIRLPSLCHLPVCNKSARISSFHTYVSYRM